MAMRGTVTDWIGQQAIIDFGEHGSVTTASDHLEPDQERNVGRNMPTERQDLRDDGTGGFAVHAPLRARRKPLMSNLCLGVLIGGAIDIASGVASMSTCCGARSPMRSVGCQVQQPPAKGKSGRGRVA